MNNVIETDYLVVGAGAAGMAITDALLTHSDANVTIVDRRHAPGGHWIDAYPFVHLHQPSAFYGVDSVPLGSDTVDPSGPNAGFYGLASADELRAYYAQVMQSRFVPGGRVRYFPGCQVQSDHPAAHRFTSLLTGVTHEVVVRRKLIDTTYLEGRIPATSAPPFEVASGVRCIAAGDVARVTDRPGRVVVLGAGKTALDVCVWLLSQGLSPDAIQWVKPREGWWLNRRFNQPHARLPAFFSGVGLQFQAMAEAGSVDEVFARLESEDFFLRVDPHVAPTMCHGAIVSERELDLLRRIQDVVRLGHVQRLEPGRMVLDGGTVSTHPDTLFVHCAAAGLARRPPRPIFEAGRLTVQPVFWSFACLQFALLGVVEATLGSDEEKNHLCPPISYWDTPADYLRAYLAIMVHERARAAHPAVATWARETRLNPLSGVGRYRDDPLVVQARETIRQTGLAAAGNLAKLLS